MKTSCLKGKNELSACTPTFTAALLKTARTWKQLKMSVDKWMMVVHIFKGILAIKKNKFEDEPRACYAEWTKSKRKRQIPYINAYIYIYIWNLEKSYWSINLGGHNRDADIQNGLVDMGKERVGWTDRVSTESNTLPYVKQPVGICCMTQGTQPSSF